jgi:uncharacterized protein (DUF433 family)
MGAATLLERELYDEQLAAHILRVNPATLHWWLEGGERGGHLYEPVLRREAKGTRTVTWGELVEAWYLREYRRTHKVQLSRLRGFISYLRDSMSVPYPLATARPWVAPHRHLMIEAQRASELQPQFWAAYEPDTGLQMLTHPAELFLERVEFEHGDGDAVRLWPVGQDAPIVIDPLVRFGSPTVAGIPTEALAEQVRAGDSVESVAADFSLRLADVISALDYEGLDDTKAA